MSCGVPHELLARGSPGAAGSLVIIGDTGADLIVGPADRWPAPGTELLLDRGEMRVGFSAANAALAVRYLGGSSRLISAVGDDSLGRWLSAQLEGVDASLTRYPVATSLSVAVVQGSGERSLLTTRGHLEQVNWTDLRPQIGTAPPHGIALLTGVFLQPALRNYYSSMLHELRALGYSLALDTGWPTEGWTDAVRTEVAAWIGLCDHVLLNELELSGVSGESDVRVALYQLSARVRPGAVLVAKMGSRGAIALHQKRIIEQSAPSVAPFDTVGAGDSFNAGYLLGHLAGQDLQGALATGCHTASAVISRFPREAIGPGGLAALLTHRASADEAARATYGSR